MNKKQQQQTTTNNNKQQQTTTNNNKQQQTVQFNTIICAKIFVWFYFINDPMNVLLNIRSTHAIEFLSSIIPRFNIYFVARANIFVKISLAQIFTITIY